MSGIARAKVSFLKVLEGAEVDPVSGMVQKSFFQIDHGLWLRFREEASSPSLRPTSQAT